MENPYIRFLAAYGPIPDGNAMYDEFVQQEASRWGFSPLNIPEDMVTTVTCMVREGLSVILTGTAGDGKTWTARKVCEGFAPSAWQSQELETRIEHDRGHVTFVKDLSEMNANEQADLFTRLLPALRGDGAEQFVVCVNDGQLLAALRAHGDATVGADIRTMLRDDLREPKDDRPFRLINMSRLPRDTVVGQVILAMMDHDGWDRCPQACPALTSQTAPCPIRENRLRLQADGSNTLSSRLSELIHLSAADGHHLPLRQIMILVVNALLGERSSTSRPIMDCERARWIAQNQAYDLTNPFANMFGANHSSEARERIAAFATLAAFEVGHETDNAVDGGLLEAERVELPDDPVYGTTLLNDACHAYAEDPSGAFDELRVPLSHQRCRLFFTLPEGDGIETPWRLSVLHYAATYLSALDEESGRKIARPLILRGLNRTLTGSMTETDDALWLTEPSGVFRGRARHLLVYQPISWSGFGVRLVLDAPSQRGRPLHLEVEIQGRLLGRLILTPTLFEFLARVANGALPNGFDSECLQEVRTFQVRCAGGLAAALREQGLHPGAREIDATDRRLKDAPIGLMEAM